MDAEPLLVWTVLVVTTCLGSRQAGWLYGLVLATLCAIVWSIFVATTAQAGSSAQTLAVTFGGSAALVALGAWAGARRTFRQVPESREGPTRDQSPDDGLRESPDLNRLSELPAHFARWLEQYRWHADPWPAFEYLLRNALKEICGAADVRAYRVLDDSHLMVPLAEVRADKMEECLRAGEGIPGWSVKTGQSYFAFVRWPRDIHVYAVRTRPPVAWCFPINRGQLVVGVVSAGSLSTSDVSLLKLVAGLINLQWNCVTEMCRARAATVTDHATGLLTRSQFLQAAPLLIEKSKRQTEPVVMAALAVDGLQRLDQDGHWGLHELAVSSIGKVLRRRLAPEVCAGRFDDSRFVMVWSGSDAQHAESETLEIVSDLQDMFADRAHWRHEIHVRFGLCRDQDGYADVQSLISEAIAKAGAPSRD